MEKQLTCTTCSEQYQSTNLPRLLPKCGHSFCENCIKNLIIPISENVKVICPEDGEEMVFDDSDINNFPKNIALIKLIDLQKAPKETAKEVTATKKDKSFNDSSLNQSNIVKHCIIEADEEDKQLITAINESTKGTESNPYNQSGSGLDLEIEEMCLVHQKPLEIVCIRDRTKICSTCAIFGDHKGHEFKSFEQVAKDKQKRCDQILHLIDKKEAFQSKVSGKDTKEALTKLLNTKRDGLCKQIKDRFLRIADTIKLAEKRALEKVTKCFFNLQEKLKEDLKMPELTNKKYLRWQQRAYRQIESFDGQNSFIEQIRLLNYDKACDKQDIIEQGEKIIKEIQRCVSLLQEYKSEAVGSIGIEFSTDIEKRLGDLVAVKETKKTPPVMTSPTARESIAGGKFKDIYEQAGVHKRTPTQQSMQSLPLVHKLSIQLQHIQVADDQLLVPHEEHVEQEYEPIVRQVRQVREVKQDLPPLILAEPEEVPKPPSVATVTTPRSQQFTPQDTARKFGSTALKDTSFALQKVPSKKRPKIKLPQKFQKILDGIINDQIELADFTNAELGDQVLLQIMDCMKGKRVKTLKLIRNKLTDEGLDKMLPCFVNVITLNLSQNLLTERFIDRLIEFLPKLPNLKSLILSQNKIKERSVKARLDEIKKYDIVVSL